MSAILKLDNPGSVLADSKKAIAKAFGRAAGTYDRCAAFQRDVADRLLNHVTAARGLYGLDVGCGTGYCTERLVNQGATMTALDLSSEMLLKTKARCGAEVTAITGDAEALPFKENSFDFALSSLALQWCEDLSLPLSEMKRVVKPGGKIYFSTLADGSLWELSEAWKAVDSDQHVNHFLTPSQINIALAQAGVNLDTLDFSDIVTLYASALELMRDLKGIGATHIETRQNRGLGGREQIRALESAYRKNILECGRLPATYHVCIGVITNE